MKLLKCFHTLLMLLLLIFAINSVSAQTQRVPTIHALLLIADADPSIGRAVDVDRQRIEGMLKVAEGICKVKTTTFLSSRNEFKSEPILQWLKNLKPDPNDTLFVYYSGHGGMNSKKETFFYLQDGYFFRSKMVSAMESAKACKLKMLISDCCSDGPESEVPTYRAVISKKVLQNLFLEHEGFLHITAASEGEYSWCSPRYGGWFTRAMVDAFDDTSDTNVDGFVSWEEVFAITKDAVQKKFRQTYGFFSADQKKDMSNRGITSQTPKYYSMAKKSSGSIQTVSQDTTKIPESNQETTKVSDTLKTKSNLWTLSNPSSSFTITIEADKPTYNIGENATFRIKTTENCYIIVINWNSQGEPIQLYPNKYETGNFAVREKEYILPSSNPKYDFRVSGSKGEERIKLIALINRNDNQTLRSLIPLDDGYGSALSKLVVVPRKDLSGKDLEAKIVDVIQTLKPSDWATANCTIQIK